MDLFLKLLFAHLLGDFVLQPDRWVARKENKAFRSPYLYLHAVVQGGLAWLLVGERAFGFYALLLAALHLAIDWAKASLQKRIPSQLKTWFLLDQALHLLVLFGIWNWYGQGGFLLRGLLNGLSALSWPLLTAYLFVTTPVSIIIKVLISHWKLQAAEEIEDVGGLLQAGAWIGILERLMVLTFILINRWEAVGFLLAAKSVFRFGDLSNRKEVHLTEYILIGTLLSFGLAILAGLLAKYLLHATL